MDLRANHTSNKKTDGRIAPRSGLAAKNFIDTGAGVIDADYRGEVKVLLFNFSDEDFVGMFSSPTFCLFFWGGGGFQPLVSVHFLANTAALRKRTVKEGDRIAQLVLERVSLNHFIPKPHFSRSRIWTVDPNGLLSFLQIYTPEVKVVDELEESIRGAGGFGSTGIN